MSLNLVKFSRVVWVLYGSKFHTFQNFIQRFCPILNLSNTQKINQNSKLTKNLKASWQNKSLKTRWQKGNLEVKMTPELAHSISPFYLFIAIFFFLEFSYLHRKLHMYLYFSFFGILLISKNQKFLLTKESSIPNYWLSKRMLHREL
jgi:hypothetical protein